MALIDGGEAEPAQHQDTVTWNFLVTQHAFLCRTRGGRREGRVSQANQSVSLLCC